MATKSDQIRELADGTLTVSEIATRVGVRYQHVRNVLAQSDMLSKTKSADRRGRLASIGPTVHHVTKPDLHENTLIDGGFIPVSTWEVGHEGCLQLSTPVPKRMGVYAFAIDGIVQYVGVATMGLAKRLYFYGRPGVTQRTSIRLNAIIMEHLLHNREVRILIAEPEDLSWNGLPVSGAAGLELGLIKAFRLPWNMRSAG